LRLFFRNVHKRKFHIAYNLDVHTTFYVSNNELIHESTTDERLARMIMFAFGSALVQARQLYPNGILTKPITVQSIFLLDELFHFVIFQLNTLNYNENTNDKRYNYVWIDKDNYLYDNRPSMILYNPVYGTERNLQRYVLEKLKYNPTVFEKFLALYLQGVK
jgi:large subunit ribosomal protein L37